MKTLLALILFTWGNFAQADDLTWTWTAPTARTDGTPLAASEIEGYRLRLNGAVRTSLLSAGSTTLVEVVSAAGDVCAEFQTVDTDGRESTWTAPVCKTVMAAPNPPSSVTVTIIIGG